MIGLAQLKGAQSARIKAANTVPGYGPAKLKRITKQLQRQYADLMDMRGEMRWLDKRGMTQTANLRDLETRRSALQRVLSKLEGLGQTTFRQDTARLPSGLEGKDRLSANQSKLAKQLMRKHGLSTLRHVYTLFFSP